MIEDMQKFDDARFYDNVLFALVSSDRQVILKFERLAEEYRERFYFFHMTPDPTTNNRKDSFLYTVRLSA